ncbi:hypothetical protein J3R30DRAFT_3416166 [Lentinula aciculospora]|uniref:Endonuclease/exonuclease/phosphatase domain-containing protein n=1 Tax=Lentinula aciculospora TaxID=153920 RepID=A0A9W9DDH5_9AGAR|nr:hypothetical protein J3R30DRAFT_3416166 [Lentinula aciculospora]
MLGDANLKGIDIMKKLKMDRTGLSVLKVSGSNLMFHRTGTKWSNIDHIITNKNSAEQVQRAKVRRQWGVTSDHFPLVTYLHKYPPRTCNRAPPKFRFDRDLIKGHGTAIVNHNRWATLSTEVIETQESLNEAANDFSVMANHLGVELGIKVQKVGKFHILNRTLRRQIDKVHKAKDSWFKAIKEGSLEKSELERKFNELRYITRKMIKKRYSVLEKKEISRITNLCLTNETKRLHQWEARVTGKSKGNKAITPVLSKEQVLLTSNKDILQRHTEYWRELVQDNPKNISNDKAYWKDSVKQRRAEPYQCDNTPSWSECLLAIRSQATGTAAGEDDIPIDLYKVLYKEECRAYLAQKGKIIDEPTVVALPHWALPNTPLTPMGKQLHRVITGIWEIEGQPRS